MDNYTKNDSAALRVQTLLSDRQEMSEVTAEVSLPDYRPEVKRLVRVSATVSPPARYVGAANTELSGTVDEPIGRHPVKRKQMAVTDKNSKNAVTHYKVIREYDGFTPDGTRFSIKKEENFDISDKRDKLVKEYDAFLKTGKFNFIEAFQDRMYSLKVLMDKIVEATGKKVRDYEDAYKGNRKYFTLGAGFRMSVFSLDAAYLISTAQSNPLDQTLRFSLSFDMDGLRDLFRR